MHDRGNEVLCSGAIAPPPFYLTLCTIRSILFNLSNLALTKSVFVEAENVEFVGGV